MLDPRIECNAKKIEKIKNQVDLNSELGEALKAWFNELLDHLKTVLGDDVVLDLLKVTEGEI